MKVGKMAATAIGGSLLILQIAHYKGYINVGYNNSGDEVRRQLTASSSTNGQMLMKQFAIFRSIGTDCPTILPISLTESKTNSR
jgi:glutamate/tyrosine decarboxylase-like PLP-dependent enzyme